MSQNLGREAESVEQSNQPTLCANGCGFFANPACANMCSKCYRDSEIAAERKASNSKAAVAALSDAQQHITADLATPEKAPGSPKPLVPALPVPSAAESEPQQPETVQAQPETAPIPETSTAPGGDEPPQRPVQKNPGRCFACNKKVGLTGFKCRCDYIFCGAHRLAEAHDCSFNYKQMERQRLAQNNPLIQAAKMERM